jgi:hypothetical protein
MTPAERLRHLGVMFETVGKTTQMEREARVLAAQLEVELPRWAQPPRPAMTVTGDE